MAQTENLAWGQGEDLSLDMIYKEGNTVETAVVVDLSSGYQLRMDIVVPATKERLYTFNSQSITDADPLAAGDQPDAELEATLTNGAGGTPNISITIPRTLTLPGGSVYDQLVLGTSVFNYDIFLRSNISGRQSKILRGTVTVEESNTLWL